jgi:hypothetical protein
MMAAGALAPLRLAARPAPGALAPRSRAPTPARRRARAVRVFAGKGLLQSDLDRCGGSPAGAAAAGTPAAQRLPPPWALPRGLHAPRPR